LPSDLPAGRKKMRRARRWLVAVVACFVLSGCASTTDVGDDALSTDDALWTGFYIGAFVLGVVGAKALLESNE
jgi:predicted small secreted protein